MLIEPHPILTHINSYLPGLHLVGGAVRDFISGLPLAKDLDFATPLSAEEIQVKLNHAGLKTFLINQRFETVSTLIDGFEIQITKYRAGDLIGDLILRDFTFNSIALSLENYQLIDPLNGRSDLLAKKIKGVPAFNLRLKEDPLRALRACRFASTLDFEIEDHTKNIISDFVSGVEKKGRAFGGVAIERISEELSKLLVGKNVYRGLDALQEVGLLKIILSEIQIFVDFEQNEFHKADLFKHTLEVISKTSPTHALRWGALLHDVGKPPTLSVDEGRRHFYKHETVGAEMSLKILEELKIGRDLINSIALLVRTHMRPIDLGRPGMKRLIRDLGDVFAEWRELKEADASSCKLDPALLSKQLNEFDLLHADVLEQLGGSKIKLEISGDDLKDLGIPFGPKIGILLKCLTEEVIDNPELNTRENLFARVSSLIETL